MVDEQLTSNANPDTGAPISMPESTPPLGIPVIIKAPDEPPAKRLNLQKAMDTVLGPGQATFSRRLDDGTIMVTDADGKERKFNEQKFINSLNLTPEQQKNLKIKYNSPENPVAIDPTTLLSRFGRAFGNTAGAVEQLKKTFDNVQIDPDKGILVEKDGVWSQIDPTGVGNGDAWDMTKEFLKDITVDASKLAVQLPAQAIGAALGSVAGPAGSIAGAGAGAGLAEAGLTSLGRLVGTYKATPEQQLKDAGLEALFGMAGETIALGVKPTLSLLAKTGKKIGKWISPTNAPLFDKIFGAATGVGEANMQIMREAPTELAAASNKLLKIAEDQSVPLTEAASLAQQKLVGVLAKNARASLTEQFGEAQNLLLKEIPDEFVAYPSQIIGDVFNKLESLGLGKVATKVSEDAEATSLLKPTFNLLSPEQLAIQVEQGKFGEAVNPDTLKSLAGFVTKLKQIQNFPRLEGKEGAKVLLGIRRQLSEVVGEMGEGASKEAVALVRSLGDGARQALDNYFLNAELPEFMADRISNAFANMNNFYTKYIPYVAKAEKAAKNLSGSRLLLNKFMNGTDDGIVQNIAQLQGSRGAETLKSIQILDAATKFSSILPTHIKSGAMKNLAQMGGPGLVGASAVGVLPASVGIGAAVAGTVMSPVIVKTATRALQATLAGTRKMTPEALRALLSNPQAFSELGRGLINVVGSTKQSTSDLLNMAAEDITNGK